jgi:hypothetical protein
VVRLLAACRPRSRRARDRNRRKEEPERNLTGRRGRRPWNRPYQNQIVLHPKSPTNRGVKAATSVRTFQAGQSRQLSCDDVLAMKPLDGGSLRTPSMVPESGSAPLAHPFRDRPAPASRSNSAATRRAASAAHRAVSAPRCSGIVGRGLAARRSSRSGSPSCPTSASRIACIRSRSGPASRVGHSFKCWRAIDHEPQGVPQSDRRKSAALPLCTTALRAQLQCNKRNRRRALSRDAGWSPRSPLRDRGRSRD